MLPNSETLLQAALQLSEPERLVLVSRLLESLPLESRGLTLDDERLEEELDRRFADESGAVSWEALRDERR